MPRSEPNPAPATGPSPTGPGAATPVARPRLLLASSSRYRRELLARLQVPFDAASPDVDETPRPGEAPADLACRLALAKARALAAPGLWTIGSDQVATLDGAPIGKPGTHEAARAQLRAASGRTMRFHTALALVDGAHETIDLVDTTVRFRVLDDDEIERYLLAERPYDCAGAAKSEGLGIALLESIEGPDPTALVGLPLIRLAARLRERGWLPFAAGPAADGSAP